jgi:hypothetical protein
MCPQVALSELGTNIGRGAAPAAAQRAGGSPSRIPSLTETPYLFDASEHNYCSTWTGLVVKSLTNDRATTCVVENVMKLFVNE